MCNYLLDALCVALLSGATPTWYGLLEIILLGKIDYLQSGYKVANIFWSLIIVGGGYCWYKFLW